MPDTPQATRPTHATAGSMPGYAIETKVRVNMVAEGSTEPDAGAASLAAPAPDSAIQDMISAIAGGGTSAFAVFYERWFDQGVDVVRVLTRRDESFCLDVVQDAMVRAIKSLRPRLGIASRQDLDRWMTRVLHTTALDHLRKESRRRAREARAASGAAHVTADSRDSTASSGRSVPTTSLVSTSDLATPAFRSEVDERIEWIRERLSEIDSLDRQLVVSQYGKDRTVASAAASVGITPGAATGRLTRLITRLRTAAKEIFHDEP